MSLIRNAGLEASWLFCLPVIPGLAPLVPLGYGLIPVDGHVTAGILPERLGGVLELDRRKFRILNEIDKNAILLLRSSLFSCH